MKESRSRKSMTRALVYYARLKGTCENKKSLDMCLCIKGACGKNASLARDIWAAHECLILLDVLGKHEILNMLQSIYVEPFMKKPARKPLKNEISMGILRFAHQNHLDERTVYRYLRYARILWHGIREKA